MTDIFISYSRKDKLFAHQQLHKVLIEEKKLDVWIDKEDIPVGEDFINEINPAIRAADNFVFVISPDSVISSYCAEELHYALEVKKRIIPVMWRFVQPCDMDEALQRLNWIRVDEDGFEQSLEKLI
jgi:hypothetical protein